MRMILAPIAPRLAAVLILTVCYLLATGCTTAPVSENRDDFPAVAGTDGGNATDSDSARPTPLPTAVFPLPDPLQSPVPPSPLPVPTYPAGYADLENAGRLDGANPEAARAIRSLPWVRDGVGAKERPAAESLIYYAIVDDSLFWDLVGKAWLATEGPDDLNAVLRDLDNIHALDPDSARRIVEMPFLETLDAPDLPALESLARLVYADIGAFRRVMAHPNVRDGITDEEAQVVALLAGVNRTNPVLVETLLDDSLVMVERRQIGLPLAGPVTLAVVRTGPGSARTMDLLEYAVRSAEALVGEPFPVRYVALLVEDAVVGDDTGANFGTHAVILPKYDGGGDGPDADADSAAVIAHEIAHFYWSGGRIWLDEGVAEFMAAYAENARAGRPLEPEHYPCGTAGGIRALESRGDGRGAAGYECNYALGERLFHDLYHRLGDAAFRSGFQRLYRELAAGEGRTPAGIVQIRRAFGEVDDVDSVVNRWFLGQESGQMYGPDSRPVIAELPEVSGWINRAYVSLSEGGSPVSDFSAGDAGEWAWLSLEYAHDYAGPPTELAFEVVEFYEDGFPYRRNSLTVRADRRHSGGVQWLSVGPGPGRAWALGRHWIYVHHEGRKVAQVEFEVVP